jgi:3,5-epimerase/4-reductase
MKKWILFGHKGWLGNYFSNLIEQTMKEVELIKPIERIHDHTNVSKLIDEVKPDRVISFAGRTSGGKYMTIDYLESEDKHAENVQDNLIGPLLLATLCSTRNIHFTYLGTGCIFTYDDQHTIANEIGFTESDAPNFKASKYSLVKGYTDQIMQLFDTRALNVRIRMPILPDEHPRNLITKLITYDKICSIPNSISVLSSLFPILVQMIERRNTGTINLVNPGFVSHNEILDAYTQIIDPNFRYNNFTPEEQAKVIKAARSNNLLDTRKLTDQCPLVLSGIEAVRKCFHTLKYVKLEKMSKSGLERFNEFITKMTQRSCWLPWVAPEVSKYAAVIIEPRKHAALEFIINSTMYFLRDQFSLYIMHGTENEEFVKQLVQKNKWKNVQLKSCHSANLTAYEYNNLLMSKNFWDTFPAAAEKVLIFQTDVLIRKFGIEKFLEYDYIGAVWGWDPTFFGNGGLSLRDIPKSRYIIEKYPQMEGNEDVHFSKRMRDIQAHLPSLDIAKEFAIEQLWHENAWGSHAFYNYHPPAKIYSFFNSIPYAEYEADRIWNHMEKFVTLDHPHYSQALFQTFEKYYAKIKSLYAQSDSCTSLYLFLWHRLMCKEKREKQVVTVIIPESKKTDLSLFKNLCQRASVELETETNWFEDDIDVILMGEREHKFKPRLSHVNNYEIKEIS